MYSLRTIKRCIGCADLLAKAASAPSKPWCLHLPSGPQQLPAMLDMLADTLCSSAGVLSESAPAATALGRPTPSDAQQASDPSLSKLQVLAGLVAEPSDWSAAGPDLTQGGHSQQAQPAEGQTELAMPPFLHQQPLGQLQPASVAGQQTAAAGHSGAARGAGVVLQQPAAAQAGTVPSLGHSPPPEAAGQSEVARGAGDATQQPGSAQAGIVPSLGHTPPPDNPASNIRPAAFQNPVTGAEAGTSTAIVEGAGAGGSTGQ